MSRATRFAYRPDVLEELLAHGMRPTDLTAPTVVRSQLNDLYRFELRRLRDRLLASAFPRHEYSARVVELRARYFLLSVPLDAWVLPATRPPAPDVVR